MKASVSAAMRAHNAQGSTTHAHLAKFTRKDGPVLAITMDHDRKITIGGIDYLPTFGVMPTNIETSAALNVDTLDVKGALMDLGVSEKDISAGLWDGCHFIAYRVNWRDLSMGGEILRSGTFGEISIGRGAFTNEVRSLTQKLQQIQGNLVTPSCPHDLFSAKCGVPMTEGIYMHVGVVVTAVASRSQFTMTHANIDGVFDGGKVTFLGGANEGLSKEIKTQVGSVLTLQEPMPYEISEGDVITIYLGCLKRWEDCLKKFHNHPRFGGFKDVPGEDQAFRGPD